MSKQTFRNYYSLRASITFSYGAHDEWNILRALNDKRRGAAQLGVANQIASFYDGRPTPPSAAEQSRVERLRGSLQLISRRRSVA